MLFPRLLLPLAVLLTGSGVQPAQAGYQYASFTFNLSNSMGPGSYGSVLLEAYTGPSGTTDHGLAPGQVRFTVTADWLAGYGDPGDAPNFGIQKFGFNTDLQPRPTDIVVTNSSNTNLKWKIKYDQNISMFGSFSVEDKGTGKTRGNPIIVTISNLGSNATTDHFVFLSDPNKGSVPAYFVAHVAGFPDEPGSHYIAVTHVAPEPSGLALALVGLAGAGLGGWRRWRRAAR
jgi:hypothetical protein